MDPERGEVRRGGIGQIRHKTVASHATKHAPDFGVSVQAISRRHLLELWPGGLQWRRWLTGPVGVAVTARRGACPLTKHFPHPLCVWLEASCSGWGAWLLPEASRSPARRHLCPHEASTWMPLHLHVCLWSLCWAKDRTCCPGWQNPYSYRRWEPVPPVFRGGAPTAPASPPRPPFLLSLQGHEITARLTWHRTHIPPLVFTWPWMPWDPVSQLWIKRSVSECWEAPSQGWEAVNG